MKGEAAMKHGRTKPDGGCERHKNQAMQGSTKDKARGRRVVGKVKVEEIFRGALGAAE